MRKCADYKTFQSLGEKLDKAEGKDKWKRLRLGSHSHELPEPLDNAGEDNSPLFDSQHLRGSG